MSLQDRHGPYGPVNGKWFPIAEIVDFKAVQTPGEWKSTGSISSLEQFERISWSLSHRYNSRNLKAPRSCHRRPSWYEWKQWLKASLTCSQAMPTTGEHRPEKGQSFSHLKRVPFVDSRVLNLRSSKLSTRINLVEFNFEEFYRDADQTWRVLIERALERLVAAWIWKS